MKEFIEYILQFGYLNQQQIDFIISKATELELHKNEYFWKAGRIPKQIGYVLEGVLRTYKHDDDGEEKTRYFIDENHLILDWEKFGNNVPPIQAITTCKLLVLSKQDLEDISNTVEGWNDILQKITAKNNNEKLEKRSPLVAQDASTRYAEFMKQFPTMVNRVPLAYVASYLGIAQQSLSRIRKNIR